MGKFVHAFPGKFLYTHECHYFPASGRLPGKYAFFVSAVLSHFPSDFRAYFHDQLHSDVVVITEPVEDEFLLRDHAKVRFAANATELRVDHLKFAVEPSLSWSS